MNSKPIKSEVGPKSLSYKDIYKLIINFNSEVDNYTEQIESPKAGNVEDRGDSLDIGIR
jgi:hypothetical protein